MGIEPNNQEKPLRFLKLVDVCCRLGISKSEAHRRIHTVANFPKPIHIGVRCVVYSSVEVDDYQNGLIAQRDAKMVSP